MPVELRRYDVTEGADDVQQASVRARRQLTSTGRGGASSCMPLLYTWTRVGYEVNLIEGALVNHSRNSMVTEFPKLRCEGLQGVIPTYRARYGKKYKIRTTTFWK